MESNDNVKKKKCSPPQEYVTLLAKAMHRSREEVS